MANYVVDASVVIEYLISGPFTLNAKALFAQIRPSDRLIVPEFCLLECTNMLWKQVRFQGMPIQSAQALLAHMRKLPLTRVPAKAILSTALAIGVKHQLAIYDSAYVALANRSRYALMTIDQPQSRAATAENIALKPITDFR